MSRGFMVALALSAVPISANAQMNDCQRDLTSKLQVEALRGEKIDTAAARREMIRCASQGAGASRAAAPGNASDMKALITRIDALETRISARQDSIIALLLAHSANTPAMAAEDADSAGVEDASHATGTAPTAPLSDAPNAFGYNFSSSLQFGPGGSMATTNTLRTHYTCVFSGACQPDTQPSVMVSWMQKAGVSSYILKLDPACHYNAMGSGLSQTITAPQSGRAKTTINFKVPAKGASPQTCRFHVEAGADSTNEVVVTLITN